MPKAALIPTGKSYEDLQTEFHDLFVTRPNIDPHIFDTAIDMILAQTVEVQTCLQWEPEEGHEAYYARITKNCEKPKYVNTQKKGLLA